MPDLFCDDVCYPLFLSERCEKEQAASMAGTVRGGGIRYGSKKIQYRIAAANQYFDDCHFSLRV